MLPAISALLPFAGKILDKVIPDPEAKAKAQAELALMQQNGELAKMANETELFKAEQQNVTDRWKSDMGSDSWLSKNIRPMTLIAILCAYFVFASASYRDWETTRLDRKSTRLNSSHRL